MDLQFGTRLGKAAQIEDVKQTGWSQLDNPICTAEASAPLFTLLECAELFRGRDMLRLVDNTPASCSYVPGRCRVWWEWIESDSNWADGISRDGFEDPIARRFGGRQSLMCPVGWPWSRPLCELNELVDKAISSSSLND